MANKQHGVEILKQAGFILLDSGSTYESFVKRHEDGERTYLDINKKDGSFNLYTVFEKEYISYDLPIDVAVGIVEYVKGLGI